MGENERKKGYGIDWDFCQILSGGPVNSLLSDLKRYINLAVRMNFSKHTEGTTSVKVHHAPGGKSNFSLAWNDGPVPSTSKPTKTPPPQAQNSIFPLQESNQVPSEAKNKVRNPPGGRSNICFG